MAVYHGPVKVDVSSWSAFKNATLGNWYDVDGMYGAQCVDYFELLNYNLGFPFPYVKAGTLGYSYEMWTDPVSRAFNQGDKYNLVTSVNDLKIGDMVVLGPSAISEYGHNGIIDSNIIVDPPGLKGIFAYLVGQNQEYPSPTQGHEVTRDLLNITTFLGAFRNKAWEGTPPTPPSPTIRKKSGGFPWYMVTRKKLVRNSKRNY